MALERTNKFLSLSDSGKAIILKYAEDEWYTIPVSAVEKMLNKDIKGVPLKRIIGDGKPNNP